MYEIVKTAKKLILWVSKLGNPGDSMMSFSFLTNKSTLNGCKTPPHPFQLGFIKGLLGGYSHIPTMPSRRTWNKIKPLVSSPPHL